VFPQFRQEPEVEAAAENLVMVDGVDFEADAGLVGPDAVDLTEDVQERSPKGTCGPSRQQQ